jgi:hypothetical protein
MGMPVVPADVSTLNRETLLLAYRAMVNRSLRYMEKNLPSAAANRAGVEGFRRPWEQALAAWSLLRATQGSDEDFRYGLNMGLAMLRGIEHRFWNDFVPLPGTPKSTKLTDADMSVLTEAVARIEEMKKQLMKVYANQLIKNVFVEKEDYVRAAFEEIVATLRRMLKDSAVDLANSNRGFVPDPALPATMGALALGRGQTSYIRIQPSLLAGASREAVLAELIPKLVHEGSHANENRFTIDYVYRNHGLHVLLPPEIRRTNAANYEQLAINWMGYNLTQWANIEWFSTKLAEEPVEKRALAIVQLKTTRAWVRSYNLRQPNRFDRSAVAPIIGSVVSEVGPAMEEAIFDELYHGANALMKMSMDNEFVLTSAPGGVSFKGRNLGTLSQTTPVTARALASFAIQTAVNDLKDQGKSAFPETLAIFTEGIAHYDEELKGVRNQLLDFLAKVGA